MLFSKMDKRNATSRNSLDPSCQLLVWRVDTIGWFRKDVHIWFTLKYISCATNCDSVHFPSTGIRTVEGTVTMWRESPSALFHSVLDDCPISVQRTGISLWPSLPFFVVVVGVFLCVSNLAEMTVIRLSPGHIRQLLICLLMDLSACLQNAAFCTFWYPLPD